MWCFTQWLKRQRNQTDKRSSRGANVRTSCVSFRFYKRHKQRHTKKPSLGFVERQAAQNVFPRWKIPSAKYMGCACEYFNSRSKVAQPTIRSCDNGRRIPFLRAGMTTCCWPKEKRAWEDLKPVRMHWFSYFNTPSYPASSSLLTNQHAQ